MEGKIIKGIGGFYYIKTSEGIIECKARGKFRHKDMKPMVGDNVTIEVMKNGKGVIEDIHERKAFTRVARNRACGKNSCFRGDYCGYHLEI